ncbi:hypothetical protein ABK040_015032 [Willaertia magna]
MSGQQPNNALQQFMALMMMLQQQQGLNNNSNNQNVVVPNTSSNNNNLTSATTTNNLTTTSNNNNTAPIATTLTSSSSNNNNPQDIDMDQLLSNIFTKEEENKTRNNDSNKKPISQPKKQKQQKQQSNPKTTTSSSSSSSSNTNTINPPTGTDLLGTCINLKFNPDDEPKLIVNNRRTPFTFEQNLQCARTGIMLAYNFFNLLQTPFFSLPTDSLKQTFTDLVLRMLAYGFIWFQEESLFFNHIDNDENYIVCTVKEMLDVIEYLLSREKNKQRLQKANNELNNYELSMKMWLLIVQSMKIRVNLLKQYGSTILYKTGRSNEVVNKKKESITLISKAIDIMKIILAKGQTVSDALITMLDEENFIIQPELSVERGKQKIIAHLHSKFGLPQVVVKMWNIKKYPHQSIGMLCSMRVDYIKSMFNYLEDYISKEEDSSLTSEELKKRLEIITEGAKLDPSCYTTRFYLANCLLYLGFYEYAFDHFLFGANVAPIDYSHRPAMIYRAAKCLIFMFFADKERAVEMFKKRIEKQRLKDKDEFEKYNSSDSVLKGTSGAVDRSVVRVFYQMGKELLDEGEKASKEQLLLDPDVFMDDRQEVKNSLHSLDQLINLQETIRKDKECAVCKSKTNLRPCERCKCKFYCCPEHQQLDLFKGHAFECERLRNDPTSSLQFMEIDVSKGEVKKVDKSHEAIKEMLSEMKKKE